MDRRKMKKMITWFALEKLIDAEWDEIAIQIFDKDEGDLTEAEKNRFSDLLQKMVDNAGSKIT